MNTITPFIILSAALSHLSPGHNDWRHKLLKRDLENKGFSHKAVEGHHKGSTEDSVLVPVHSEEDFGKLLDIARGYGQESVLYVDANGWSTLNYTADHAAVAYVGQWHQISPHAAKQLDSYSYIDGAYYAAA